ncbi:MAG: porin [Planctomycetaceae bacterium]|jgi:hypothetical protein|nr:porin [Planctomycetaceae bacterium]
MKHFILKLFGILAVVMIQCVSSEINAGVFSEDAFCGEVSTCNPCDEVSCDPCESVCAAKKSKWFVSSYLETGFWANEYGQKNVYLEKKPGYSHSNVQYGNGWLNMVPLAGVPEIPAPLQNVKNTGVQLNQLYFSAGKSVDGRHGWDFGGTVDFVFGTDAYAVQTSGLEKDTGHGPDSWGTGDYYSAFAQAYFEAAYKNWNIKAGKFYTPFGSQSFKSTDRFFYSYADTFSQFPCDFIPVTAGGAYATYTVNNQLSVYGGWIQPDMIGESSKVNAFLGGMIWQLTKKLNLHYTIALGKDESNVFGTPNVNNIEFFVQSLVTTYQINKKWKYVFDWSLYNSTNEYKDYVQDPNDDNLTNGNVFDRNMTYGINNELIYQFNSKWAFGFRAGWGHMGRTYRDTDSAPPYKGEFHQTGSGNKYTFSLAANWTPVKWLIVKPEIRYDKYEKGLKDGSSYGPTDGPTASRWGHAIFPINAFDRQSKDYQLSGGVSTIVKY